MLLSIVYFIYNFHQISYIKTYQVCVFISKYQNRKKVQKYNFITYN